MRSFVSSLGLAAVLLSGALTVLGCDRKKSEPAKAEESATPMTAAKFGGAEFSHPAEWTTSPVYDDDSLDVRAPMIENIKVPAAVNFKVIEATRGESLDAALDGAAVAIEQKTAKVISRQVIDHPAGFKYGRLEYTKLQDSEGTKLTCWDLIIPMPGLKYLNVQAKSPTDQWTQSQPLFTKIIDSIRVPKTAE